MGRGGGGGGTLFSLKWVNNINDNSTYIFPKMRTLFNGLV